MVVDDQQEMLNMLTRIFELEGYDVAVATMVEPRWLYWMSAGQT